MSSTKEPELKEEQLDLGFKEPLQNKFWKVKGKLAERLRFLESLKYLRSSHVWLMLGISLTLTYLLYNYITTSIRSLPEQVPLLLNYIKLDLRLVDRYDLEYLWVGAFVATIISIILSAKLFNRKPHLSYFILIVLAVSLTTSLYRVLLLIRSYI